MSDKARVVGAIALAGCLMGFSWSDWWPPVYLQGWWPPTLQQKIGELEAKVNAAETEKSALLRKVTEVSQAADNCKAQSDQMAKAQDDLKARVDQLQVALADTQAKLQAQLQSKSKPAKPVKKGKK
jgi:predicted RNase H-like nuclease (RuvC/YqgF family)